MLVFGGRHAPDAFVVVVVSSWVEYRQAYMRTPRTGTPRHNVVGGVWWWLWWHIVGLSINKPNTLWVLVVGFFLEHY